VGSDNIQKIVKYGMPNPAMEMCYELQICPDLILAAIAAAAAAAFYFLYTAITKKGKKRRRRDIADGSDDDAAAFPTIHPSFLESLVMGTSSFLYSM
jgi:hypothetical protein